jgi:dolichyl-phosphate-mannose--protein O-mannosyl transferase
MLAGTLAFSARLRQRFRSWFDPGQGKALAILGVSWVSMMLLWFSGRISSYWYHYLTPYAFAVVLTAGVVSRLDRGRGRRLLVFVALVLLAFAYFAPVWGELPISVSAAHRRLIFDLWR